MLIQLINLMCLKFVSFLIKQFDRCAREKPRQKTTKKVLEGKSMTLRGNKARLGVDEKYKKTDLDSSRKISSSREAYNVFYDHFDNKKKLNHKRAKSLEPF